MPPVDPRAPAKESGIGSLVLGAFCWIIVMFTIRPILRPAGMFQSFLATIAEGSITMSAFGAIKTGQFVIKDRSRVPKLLTLVAIWVTTACCSLALYHFLVLRPRYALDVSP